MADADPPLVQLLCPASTGRTQPVSVSVIGRLLKQDQIFTVHASVRSGFRVTVVLLQGWFLGSLLFIHLHFSLVSKHPISTSRICCVACFRPKKTYQTAPSLTYCVTLVWWLRFCWTRWLLEVSPLALLAAGCQFYPTA